MGFFMYNEQLDTYEEKVRRAIDRERNSWGNKDDRLIEGLCDEYGRIPGCFLIKPAPTE